MNTAAKLAELSLYIPEFDKERADMLRELACRVGREAGLTKEEGFKNLVAINIALTRVIQLGYALAEYDRHQGPIIMRCEAMGLKGAVN